VARLLGLFGWLSAIPAEVSEAVQFDVGGNAASAISFLSALTNDRLVHFSRRQQSRNQIGYFSSAVIRLNQILINDW